MAEMSEKEYHDRLKGTMLGILDEVDRICKKHGLRYFLVFGTLLGAIRHQGFIPWDDDIDIGMPRKDYDRFISLCQKELPGNMYVQDVSTNTRYWLKMAKIRLKGTVFLEKIMENSLIPRDEMGIYIDVFPFEGLKHITCFTHFRHSIVNKILVLEWAKEGISKLSGLKKLLSDLVPMTALVKICNKLQRVGNVDNPQYFYYFGMPVEVSRNFFTYDQLFPLQEVSFEGKKYPAPNDIHHHLKSYGDYMKLPSAKDQINHNPVLIDFGEGPVNISQKEGTFSDQ